MKKDYSKKIQKDLLEILEYFCKICKENNLTYYLGEATLLGAIRHNGFIPWDDDIDIYMPREDYEKLLKLNVNNEKFWLDNYKTNKQNWNPYSKIRYKNTEFREINIPDYIVNQEIWIDIFPVDNTNNNFLSFLKIRKKIIQKCKNFLLYKNINKKEFNSIYKKIIFIIIKFIPNILIIKLREFLMIYENKKKNKYLINFASKYSIEKQLYSKEDIFPLKSHKFANKEQFIPNNSKLILEKIYGAYFMTLPPKEKRKTSHIPKKIKFSDGEEIFFNK